MNLPYRFLGTKSTLALIAVVFLFIIVSVLVVQTWGLIGLVIMGGAAFLILMLMLGELLLRLVWIKRRAEMDYEQVQALVGLYHTLKPRMPLLDLRRYAMSPDTLVLYQYLIERESPMLILELGGGMSTVVSATLFSRRGSGRTVALDDDEEWTRHTQSLLETHEIDGSAEVRYAPLEEIEHDGVKYKWYAESVWQDLTDIELLVVDGPVDSHDRGARYPALPLLLPKLADRATILVDDTFRPRWRERVLRWAQQNGFDVEAPYPNEKQSLILRRGH
jgi:hypothetical protein